MQSESSACEIYSAKRSQRSFLPKGRETSLALADKFLVRVVEKTQFGCRKLKRLNGFHFLKKSDIETCRFNTMKHTSR
jgi:hypothetical protein